MRSASSRQNPRSLRIHSTAKPKSNSPAAIVPARLSICQLWAAPLPMTSKTLVTSRPARVPKSTASERRLHDPGDADLVDHLRQLPGPGRADQLALGGVGREHRGRALEHGRVVAPGHHGQRAVLGADLAAGDRRVDEPDSDARRRRRPAPGPARPTSWCGRRAWSRPPWRPARPRHRTRRHARRRRCRRTSSRPRRPRRRRPASAPRRCRAGGPSGRPWSGCGCRR